ncbi:tetratricopeptide (TPR) repeat protein [Inhella inkyongensis]|uniref:Tetratricopeptide (TPR) repeat protein n=1 Tax=Inhella inkyongensis TaxID=392593 RepID=A0A840S832_9BURK|nr:tetratricopeptide repeat protein [Inhella inkyongensis]MBB5204954.1 tetratricopeptide (TPR) repeat protein [Inhella inkyongensis]
MRLASPRPLVIALAALLLCATPTQAAVFKDAQLEALNATGQFAELEPLAQARLKANAADAEASAALALALSLLDPADARRLEAGAAQAQRCTEQHPNEAVCHLAKAQNLGQQMLNMGMVKALRSVGALKEIWTRTLELEPTSFTARVQLAKLYVTVPGMMGGSLAKAKALEAAVRSSQPETARIIRVFIAAEGKQWGEMERELQPLRGSKDAALQEQVREATLQLALVYLNDGRDLAKAKSLYEGLLREQPTHAAGSYGLGRVQVALGQPDEGVRLLERARSLSGAADLPIDHRLGEAYLAQGDKAQAKTAWERYLTNKRAKPANLDDVRKRLAQLT